MIAPVSYAAIPRIHYARAIGRLLLISGAILIAAGLVFQLGGGRLPGDIYIRGKNSTFYFPVVTCIVASVILSFVLWLFRR